MPPSQPKGPPSATGEVDSIPPNGSSSAGDEETARACQDILEQERAMAQYIEENWDRFADLSLREDGVPLG